MPLLGLRSRLRFPPQKRRFAAGDPVVFPMCRFEAYEPRAAPVPPAAPAAPIPDSDDDDDSTASVVSMSSSTSSDQDEDDEDAPPPVPATPSQFPINLHGSSLTQTPEHSWYFDRDDPHGVHVAPHLCPAGLMAAIRVTCDMVGWGFVLLGQDYAQEGTAIGQRMSSMLAMSRHVLKMPELHVMCKEGEVYPHHGAPDAVSL
eukprot:CAMPEP_0185800992 /NCGR_PEP_ID=MMETSP1322-20130828/1196_1 /TAXON_ID=265543 /ORGANISM="Minutocellus polymorphus, Strain RCC2270" /LENGTH=201 /DNA_ID=CAMNT_0028496667 /DNA_START=347 /DNA_END=953 /DNA_ORIENTATION=+